ncbi:MAG: hypothetical protein H0T51_20540 [Pirellulales bacterium]|nr:hypothetical protein [Pirellulales bacterium]
MPASAQDNPFDDFGGEPAATDDATLEDAPVEEPGEADADAPPAEDPPPAAAQPASAAVDGAALADYARRLPAVAAVLDLPRETPAQKFRAVTMLIDLGHPEVASLLLPELLQGPIDDAGRAALVREFGTARFMKLIRLDSPAAPGPLAGIREFAQTCLDAAAAEATDPAKIAALIAQLNAPTEDERYAARVDLRATGDAGVAAAFAALSAAETEDARANIMAALAEMRPAVNEPLLAVLADADGTLRRDAAELAGHLRISEALPLLAAVAVSNDASAASAARAAIAKLGKSAPSAGEAQLLLRQRLASLQQGPSSAMDDKAGVWWSWVQDPGLLVRGEFTPRQIHSLSMARVARALIDIDGVAIAADRRTAVTYILEDAANWVLKDDSEERELLQQMSPQELNSSLGEAVSRELLGAAAKLAAELGRRGDATILATADGRPSPLAAALISPERDLRFAALAAIMQLAPAHSFPGASHVPEALWYFVAGAGNPAAITASADVIQAGDWAGQLRGLGYEATQARLGREALLAAVDPANSARLGIVVLDSDIGQPLLGEVVYQLHTNQRTAGVPILIASSVHRLGAAQRIADSDPLTLAAPRPHGEGALTALVGQTLALAPRPLAPQDVRTAQAAQALGWLAKLLADGSPYDELPRDGALVHRTLLTPELSGPSLAVLAALGTGQAQTALLDYASAYTLPIETRRVAAKAFAANVERHGLNLTREQIHRQYDRYNASETADPDTQQVLGQILDVLER